MNAIIRCVYGLTILMVGFARIQTSAAATNQPTGFRLTVELRDGSKIVGRSKDDDFQFHSDVLGEIRLPLAKVRAFECLPDTNLVKLTTVNEDSLLVQFAMKDIRVETSFGTIKLPADSIKSARVFAIKKTGRTTDGLIGLWSGEGNAADSAGGNDGVMQNVSFTDGVAGQAFTFAPESFPYGTYVGVQIPDKPAYVLTQALTIDAWVRPRGNGYIIMCRGDHRPGLDPYTLSMQANHDLRFQICNEENDTAAVDAFIPYGEWTHVAATFDGSAGMISLYTNGVLAAQMETHLRPIGNLIPEMSPGLGIGNLNDGGNNFPFNGDIDEIALYNRALSVDEIDSIYSENAGHAGGHAELLPPRTSPPFRFGNNRY
jgi:hypothetical protein